MLPNIPVDNLITIAPQFSIMGQEDFKRIPFTPNEEQVDILKSVCNYDKTLIVKSRQVGSTTVILFYIAIIALATEGINIGLVVDSWDKASDFIARVRDFLDQKGIPIPTKNTKKLVLFNGTTISAVSAGTSTAGEESNVGRSTTYHLLLLSEFPYYASPSKVLNSISNSSPKAKIIMESTAKMPEDAFHNLYTEDNDYNKLFFGVESHKAYKKDPNSITDQEWEDLQKEYHFTSRPSAAWWLSKLRDQGNDLISHLRDYPVIPEHSFSTSLDRWIFTDPEVLKPGEENSITIFHEPSKITSAIIGVDTAGARGKDASSIVVIDRQTKKLLASFWSTTIEIDDLVDMTKILHNKYSSEQVIIEDNGIGQGTYQKAAKLGMPVYRHNTQVSNRYDNLLLVKRAIEEGILKGDNRLLTEARSIQLKNDKFINKKDMLMAISFCYGWMEKNPYVYIPPKARSQDVYVASYRKKRKSRW